MHRNGQSTAELEYAGLYNQRDEVQTHMAVNLLFNAIQRVPRVGNESEKARIGGTEDSRWGCWVKRLE
jgi:hypothetical protein